MDIAEDVKGPYASSPADIRATAENIAENYSSDPSILAGAICAALVSERERCAKVADDAAIPPRVRLRVSDDMLRELVRLAGKATPGPWDTDEPNIVYSMAGGGCVYLANTEGLDTSAQQCRDDASFIEAADPPTVAALASELLKLREAVKPFAAIKAGEAVPVGWMLVPVEPTEAMCSADAGTATTDRLAWNRAMYRAMIAASPQPEASDSLVQRLRGPHRRSECGNFAEVHPDCLNEAASRISTLERELEEARLAASVIEGVSNELDIALTAAVDRKGQP
jgi:hypothetical protein